MRTDPSSVPRIFTAERQVNRLFGRFRPPNEWSNRTIVRCNHSIPAQLGSSLPALALRFRWLQTPVSERLNNLLKTLSKITQRPEETVDGLPPPASRRLRSWGSLDRIQPAAPVKLPLSSGLREGVDDLRAAAFSLRQRVYIRSTAVGTSAT